MKIDRISLGGRALGKCRIVRLVILWSKLTELANWEEVFA